MDSKLTQGTEVVKHVIDAGAIAATGLALLHSLPEISAGLSCIWMTLRIGEWIYKKFKKS